MIDMRKLLRDLKYNLWALNGFVGLRQSSKYDQKVTVLITYYNPVRMKHVNHQIRNILKCDFVEKVIISNHNPDIDINTLVEVKSKQVIVLNQDVRRGCGYRWQVAQQFAPDYLIVVDDDILLFPWQLKTLFNSLITEPEIPHGFAGMVRQKDGYLEYRQKEDRSIDYLCEIYAITGSQLERYGTLRGEVVKNESLTKIVDSAADFMVVSQTGSRNPKIHDGGRLFRCPTYNAEGVAVHMDNSFDTGILEVIKSLDDIASRNTK